MLIQIQPIQIPQFWELIKFAAVATNNIEEEHQDYYILNMLQDLLASKKTAFVIFNGDNQVTLVVVIEIRRDDLRDQKIMYMDCLYSFEKQPEENWGLAVMDLAVIAKKADCKAILGDTANPNLAKILEANGGECVSKRYKYTF